MDMIITFDGKKKVNAEYRGQTIYTDQAVKAGGDGEAPEPFTLFLASIGTCAGIYVKSFCEQRNIPTDNIRLIQSMNFNPEVRLIDQIDIQLELPDDFPEKYKDAVINAADLCTVKKHLASPPKISVTVKQQQV